MTTTENDFPYCGMLADNVRQASENKTMPDVPGTM